MLTLIIILAVVAVLLVASTTLVVTTRRRPRIDPAAPPATPAAPPPATPEAPPPRGGIPSPAPPAPGVEPGVGSGVEAEPGVGSGVEAELDEVAPAELDEVAPAELEVPGVVSDDFEEEPAAGGAAVALAEPPRFRDRLGKARSLFSGYLTSVRSRDRIDASTWDDLEEALILADVGLDVTASLLDGLRARVRSDKLESPSALLEALKSDLIDLLEGDRELHLAEDGTTVWLFVGVNGVGKTTTIGKLALRQQADGHGVVMAAGDTFRAAAADQLQGWADRVGAAVVRGNEGGDPASVIFDAVQHAAARGSDLVLADTAGRLHTKVNLMEELKKVRRVAERPPGQVSEVLLVIDATTGQNGLVQAKQFTAAVDVTGVVLTKLDGTAKGGIALAITAELGIPIKAVGLGEKAEDLVPFDAREFVDALFEE